MSDRPNFLIFVTDQHRADWLGCMGHPVVRTPNIDAIAAQGTCFTESFVAAPVCMPNRAALMTGRMPAINGVRHNGCPLPATAHTFVDVLAEAGYDTAALGKCHFQPFTTIPANHGPQPTDRLVEEAWRMDPADYGHEQPARYAGPERYALPTPYYGFQHVEMVTGHGDTCGGHYAQWFRQAHPDAEALTDPANELPHGYTCPQAYRTPIPPEFYPTTWIADRAIDYLTNRQTDSPFCAFVSFPDPHHPFNPPGPYWDMYSPGQFAVDLPYAAHRNPIPPMEYLHTRWTQGLGGETPQAVFCADDQHLREAMALTAGMITLIDDQIGRVMAALKACGADDNTVVLFLSDHGDHLGDFNMLLKGPMLSRGLTRVPLIWSDPAQRKAHRSSALTSTIDISASILDRVGLTPYNGMQGRSFLPCLGTDAPHRDAVYIEHTDAQPRAGFDPAARSRGLVTATHRLTCYHGANWGELYDRRSDPNECHNLWSDPSHAETRAELTAMLVDQMSGHMETSRLSTKLA